MIGQQNEEIVLYQESNTMPAPATEPVPDLVQDSASDSAPLEQAISPKKKRTRLIPTLNLLNSTIKNNSGIS